MLQSMTGFGKYVVTIPTKKITVEIKSLNSKQLDINTRIPAVFREKELDLRNMVSSRLQRGKVDMQIYSEPIGVETTVSLNLPLMAAYKAQVEEMAVALGIPWPEDWYSVLMRFPETVKSELPDTLTDDDIAALHQAVEEALEALVQFRSKEAERIR